ncbi:MAG: protein-glutamate O-methyltransferase CheR, partial [Myxococcota bacterium]
MPFLFDQGPSLTATTFRLLRDLVNGFCGIYFEPDVAFLVERRLRDRLAAIGVTSFESYYAYLRDHPEGGAELE